MHAPQVLSLGSKAWELHTLESVLCNQRVVPTHHNKRKPHAATKIRNSQKESKKAGRKNGRKDY